MTRTAARESFLADILSIAVEGSMTNSYAEVTAYHWYSLTLDGGSADPAPNGGGNATATLYLPEGVNDDDETYQVTIDTIATGLNRISAGTVKVNSDIARRVKAANRDNVGDLDAIDADCILQAGLFDEIVFG